MNPHRTGIASLARRGAALVAVGAIALACCGAGAQVSPGAAAVDGAASAPALAAQSVTITGHVDTAVGSSDSASQGVVYGERLADLPLLRPGEVLETVPGLVVTQHSGDGKANQYFLRGYNLDHGTDFATFIDGVPVNMPTNAHGQGYADLNYLIPELVDTIAYRKGPYFADSRDFSATGSARIAYVDHVDRAFANLTVGGFGYRRLLLAGSPPLLGQRDAAGSVAPRLLGAIEFERADGPWLQPERLRKANGLLRLSDGNRASGWSLDAVAYAARWNSTDQVPLSLIDSGQLPRFGAIDPTDGGNSGRTVVSGEWHRHDERGYARLAAYLEHYRLQLWSNFTYFELRPQTGDQFEQVEHRNIFGGEAVRGWTHRLLGKASTSELGVHWRADRIRVGLANTEARVPFATVRDDDIGETAIAAYLQNTTHWTPWLRSLVGLRVDRLQLSMTAFATPANSGHASGSRLSPKLSLIFGPWQRTEFFVNAGQGFHSNDARGVIDRIDPTTGAAASPVPALVGSRGAELGLRSEIVPGLQTSLAWWRLDSDSELVFAADSAIGSTSPNGASRRRGLEWNNHLVVDRWLLLDADLSWIHARYAKDNDNGELGNSIPNAVPRVVAFGVTFKPASPWSGGIVIRHIGAYPLSQDGTLTAAASTVTNLHLRRELSSSASLSVELLNAFDRRYFDIAYAQDYRVSPTSPVVPQGITVHPGEPRQIRAALKLQF